MAKLSILAQASEDLEAAYAWYFERGERLAESFEAAIELAFDQVAEFPGRYPRYDAIHRFYLVRRFPYLIVYRIDNDEVIVVAVAHGSR